MCQTSLGEKFILATQFGAVKQLRSHREALGLTQSQLARLSGISRFRICRFEMGDITLRSEEQRVIYAVLAAEAKRLRNLPVQPFEQEAAAAGK
jgi:predicted transcriptional regulator